MCKRCKVELPHWWIWSHCQLCTMFVLREGEILMQLMFDREYWLKMLLEARRRNA